jgi:hypothetical protein
MSTASLEQRVSELERQLAELRSLIEHRPGRDAWKSVVGMFADDPGIEEIHRETRRIREEDRRAAREQGES